MRGRIVRDEQIGKTMQDVVESQSPGDNDGEAAPPELIDDREHPERLTVVCAVLDEVIAPHVVGSLGPAPDT